MTRTVRDAAAMMTAISRPDSRDWFAIPADGRDYEEGLEASIKGLRIAYSPALGYAEVEPEIASMVEAAVKVLEGLGAIVEVTDPSFADPGPTIFRVLWWCGARSLLAKLPEEKKALLDPGLADVLRQSMDITLDDYLDAVRQRGLLGSQMRQFMESYDLLVTPTMPITAFDVGLLSPMDEASGKWVNWTPFTYPFNLTQQPAASVPCGFASDGLPVGLHIVGRMFDDATVLRASHAYEAATEWHQRKPTL
jgi:aspartyl-tRNA(Asn)/glutamyl-tRNA(Gln) amidotransferase subunit A